MNLSVMQVSCLKTEVIICLTSEGCCEDERIDAYESPGTVPIQQST